MSKLDTVDYLKSHFDEDVNLSKIYRNNNIEVEDTFSNANLGRNVHVSTANIN